MSVFGDRKCGQCGYLRATYFLDKNRQTYSGTCELCGHAYDEDDGTEEVGYGSVVLAEKTTPGHAQGPLGPHTDPELEARLAEIRANERLDLARCFVTRVLPSGEIRFVLGQPDEDMLPYIDVGPDGIVQ